MSEGCRDARDIAWTLEEMECDISWPLKIITDSNGAYSFQKDNVSKSKLRGCIDRRDNWVAEVQDAGSINAEWISHYGLGLVISAWLAHEVRRRIRMLGETPRMSETLATTDPAESVSILCHGLLRKTSDG